jgi:hypothetical protein
MIPGRYYEGAQWLNCGPYRINEPGHPDNNRSPVYYADNIKLEGIDFFVHLTEIRDDGGYEWYPMYLPGDNITTTSARGIRHLRRGFDSMVLPVLFTHEYFFETVPLTDWNTIMSNVTNGIAPYEPVFTTMDFAIQYLRAKTNTRVTNVVVNQNYLDIYYSGNNDMDIQCYLFTEDNGQISFELINLPQLNGNSQVTVNY